MNTPQEIRLNRERNTLILIYENQTFELSAEYLRVHSPSAEVRGHSQSQAILQTGKRLVLIKDLQAAGNYALKISFSDGHDSGLYDWAYLYDLGAKQAEYWQAYLQRLAAAHASRDVQAA